MNVLVAISEFVATVTLNRPQAMNAIDPALRSDLKKVWRRLGEDDAVRVVVLTGAGNKAFCTGSDLKNATPAADSFATLNFGRAESDHLLAGMEIDKPMVCAINGYALGGGLEMALACDIRIAAEHAQFALPEARIGSIPGAGGTQRLPRAIGLSNAMLMLLTGERIDAAEALRIGLVSQVTSAAELLPAAQAIATRIAHNAPLSVRAIRRLARQGADLPLAAALESERYVFGVLRETEDRAEGRQAFREKRPPVYKGR